MDTFTTYDKYLDFFRNTLTYAHAFYSGIIITVLFLPVVFCLLNNLPFIHILAGIAWFITLAVSCVVLFFTMLYDLTNNQVPVVKKKKLTDIIKIIFEVISIIFYIFNIFIIYWIFSQVNDFFRLVTYIILIIYLLLFVSFCIKIIIKIK